VPVFGISLKIYNRKGGGVPANQNMKVCIWLVPGIKAVG
jgi:hypothetical protein